MTARLIRHTELLPEMPDTWRCVICRGPERTEDGALCERCGGPLHWSCYWPGSVTVAERDGLAAAVQADEDAPTRRVRVRAGARRFEFDVILGRSAANDFTEGLILLCPGCRS